MASITVVSFAELGVMCYRDGALADGLELLAHRLDYAGAGDLVAELLGLEFTGVKQDPKPVPTPKPPPPPPPPPKGERPPCGNPECPCCHP